MSHLIVIEHISLDGVMQAPGRPDEDCRGGFEYGGWAMPNNDEVMGKVMGRGMTQGGSLLFGRRTYEDFYGFWPNQENNPFTEVLNAIPKYVVSTTLSEPLPWSNSTLLKGNIGQAIADLKAHSERDITVLGSGQLVQSLMQFDLVDKYLLMIHPLILGTGHRLFADGIPLAKLRLADSVTTTKGVIIATYEPAREGSS